MSGYARQVITLKFDDLAADPENDRIWVVIKNPQLQPPQALRPPNPEAYEKGDDGKLKDPEAASEGGQAVAAKLVVAWRVYDPTSTPEFDPDTGEEIPGTGRMLLPAPPGGDGVPPEAFAKLPRAIQTRIMETISEAMDPPQDSGAPTAKMSSGQPSPSTTAPGAAAQPLPSSPTTS